jgi:RNA polymerase sigma-70 factor (ECF subfamily)
VDTLVTDVERGGRSRVDGQPSDHDRASDAVAGLYALHRRDVYRYLLGLTRSHDEAEDICEEAFVRAYRTMLAGRWPGDAPLPWLLLTARRIATDRWRRLRRLASMRPGPRAAEATDGGRERTEFWLWFEALAGALSERQREVLLLRYQRDLTDEQIGCVMGLTASGVRSLVARALGVIREHPELTR